MRYAPSVVWRSTDRWVSKLREDGTVEFAEDVSEADLRWAVGALLRDREQQRQKSINLLAMAGKRLA